MTTKQSIPMTRRQLLQSLSLTTTGPSTINLHKPLQAVMPYVNEVGITPVEHFYNPVGHDVPLIMEENWRMRLSGLVTQSISMTLEELRAMPSVDLPATIINMKSRPDQFLMGHALWRGVPFSSIIKYADMGAKYAAFRSANGYTTYLPLERLKSAVLATEMNGEPLSKAQGHPLRLIVSGVYDYKLPKWIINIEFVETEPSGYFESRGWPAVGDVQTVAMIFTPRIRQECKGLITFSGMAFAGDRDIQNVELSVDDGDWMPVSFLPAQIGSWTQWYINWMPPAVGDYVVRVRATDAIQSLSPIHSVLFRVVS